MAKKQKPIRKYRDYSIVQDGKLYGSVSIPIGNGKYKIKRHRVANKTEARQWALEELRKHGLGEPEESETETEPAKRKNNYWTFYKLAEWYIKEFVKPPRYVAGQLESGMRSYQEERRKINRLVKYFGLYRLDDITISVLRGYREKRLSGEIVHKSNKGQKKIRVVSITSVNRDLSTIRAMFQRAVFEGFMKSNPFAKVAGSRDKLIDTKLEKRTRRVKEMTDQQANELMLFARQSLNKRLAPMLAILRYTGARPSEIFPWRESKKKPSDGVPREPLIWQSIVDSNFTKLVLIEYKNDERIEKPVPIHPKLEPILREYYERINPKKTDRLFNQGSFYRGFLNTCKRAGITGVTMRDYREYCNRYWIKNGVTDAERMAFLGHKSIQTNMGYFTVGDDVIANHRERAEEWPDIVGD